MKMKRPHSKLPRNFCQAGTQQYEILLPYQPTAPVREACTDLCSLFPPRCSPTISAVYCFTYLPRLPHQCHAALTMRQHPPYAGIETFNYYYMVSIVVFLLSCTVCYVLEPTKRQARGSMSVKTNDTCFAAHF